MRQVEAARMYAAENGGKFPARLEDPLWKPVPIDPIHGKPFDYKIEGDSAVLRASSPVGSRGGGQPPLHRHDQEVTRMQVDQLRIETIARFCNHSPFLD